MIESRVFQWLSGRRPVVAVESGLPKVEILRRAGRGLAEQASAHYGRSTSQRVSGYFAGSSAGYVDGWWGGDQANLWWHPTGSRAGLAANLHVTFDPDETGPGTRMSAQVRLAPLYSVVGLGVAGVGLLMLLVGLILAAVGLGTGLAWISLFPLILGLLAPLLFRLRLLSDVAPLWQFFRDCVEGGVENPAEYD